MSETLTKDEMTCLNWSVACNEDGIGFLGQSVMRGHEFPEYQRLVEWGFVELRAMSKRPRYLDAGYWITPAGREARALANLPEGRG